MWVIYLGKQKTYSFKWVASEIFFCFPEWLLALVSFIHFSDVEDEDNGQFDEKINLYDEGEDLGGGIHMYKRKIKNSLDVES